MTVNSKVLIKFNDLSSQNQLHKKEYLKSINKIVKSSKFLLGEELNGFEKEFSIFLETKGKFIGVANGSDALLIALLAKNLERESQVIVATNTYFAAAASVIFLGLRPKFIDVEIETRFPNDKTVSSAISDKVSAYIKSHLFGGADISQVSESNNGIIILNDASQAHGTQINNKFIGGFETTTFSFYPGKNLGSFGDAGGIVSFMDSEVDKILRLRNQGTFSSKYLHEVVGFNSRMSEIQASILRIKLQKLHTSNRKRKAIFERYKSNLKSISNLCHLFDYPVSVDPTHHLVQIRIPGIKASSIQKYLLENGIETGRHYPLPLHLQPAFRYLGYSSGDFPNAEILAEESLSIPIYPTLKNWEIDLVSEKIIWYCLKEM